MGSAKAGQLIMNYSMVTLLGLLVALTLLSSAHAFDCKRYTVKQIEISGNQTGNMSEIFRTTKDTQRCSAVYKLDNTTCSSMQLTCGRWYLPNKDPVQCRRGDKFLIKVDDSKPRVFCEHEKPTSYYPAYSFQRMKVWFSAAVDSKFPNSGATCKIKCAEVLS